MIDAKLRHLSLESIKMKNCDTCETENVETSECLFCAQLVCDSCKTDCFCEACYLVRMPRVTHDELAILGFIQKKKRFGKRKIVTTEELRHATQWPDNWNADQTDARIADLVAMGIIENVQGAVSIVSKPEYCASCGHPSLRLIPCVKCEAKNCPDCIRGTSCAGCDLYVPPIIKYEPLFGMICLCLEDIASNSDRVVTHEQISSALGIEQKLVEKAVSILSQRGFVTYDRGQNPELPMGLGSFLPKVEIKGKLATKENEILFRDLQASRLYREFVDTPFFQGCGTGKQLTDSQFNLLHSILGLSTKHGRPALVREIGATTGIWSSCRLARDLWSLEKARWIRRKQAVPDSVYISSDAADVVG